MYRLLYLIPTYILSSLITLPFHLLGFILIPLACCLKAYKRTSENEDKPKDGATYHFTWFFMYFWDNESSDGIACRAFYESKFKKYGYIDMLITTFVWSAIRNPINNLKRLLSPKFNFQKLSHIGSKPSYAYKANYPCWYLIWQDCFGGFYYSFNFKGKLYYIKIGYKFRPYHNESQISESQLNGVGSTFRIIPKKV